ncbi:MAG: WD40/YVTN/BNR-like repeat-containing protein [Gemmatimonadaceae bacterium]
MLRRAAFIALALPLALSAQAPKPKPMATPSDPSLFQHLRYRNVGPARGGRVTTVTGVPSQPHTFYMGSTGGGIWRTTDAGQSWANISDRFFAVGSMGAVEVSLSNPDVIYVGGGSDGLRSNVSVGDGVYKSTDAGKTWQHVGLTAVGNIGGTRVHPSNPDIAFVAAIGNPFKPTNERGLYRTTDGGKTWQRVLYVSDSTGAVDVEFQPGNPNTLYASMWRAERKPWTIISGAREGGVYKSTDGGSTWKKLTNGLPNQLVGKSNVAVTPADPNVVWVLMEAKPGNGLYRSTDAGESFTLASDYAQLITRPFYYTNITAHPKDANTVWVGAEGFHLTTDGGKTWRAMPTPHGDNHDLWINPTNPQLMVQSNDGGANVSLNGGRTWSTIYNQPTAEIYQVYVDNQFPYRLYGAQQDNSTLIVPSLPLSSGRPDSPMQEWRTGPGCETGPLFPHPTNPDTVYGSCKGQFSRLRLRSGSEKQYWVGAQSLYGNATKDLIYRFQRVSPMEFSPHDARVVYYGSQHLHRTRDEGVTWETISPDLTWNPPERRGHYSGEPITIDGTGEESYSTLYAIREATLEKGVIWTGANDGPFYVTRDDGKTWKNITPKNQPAGCRVQNIEPSPHRRGSAYYAVLCYLLGDFRPFIWRTDDYGTSWKLLTDGTNGIAANEPTRVVREDPKREGLLYAGTEFGMYVSFDNGATWKSFQQNLPHTPITDMKVHQNDLVISTQGRSFWILDNLTALHQLAANSGTVATLFAPRDAVRARYAGSFGGVEGNRSDPADPQYPPAGAMIDYHIEPSFTGPVTLEILDANRVVLRSFTSAGAGESVTTEPSMRQMVTARAGAPRLPRNPGMNRFNWDLTVAGPWTAGGAGGGRGGSGPTVVPDKYYVQLTAGVADGANTPVSWIQPLTVKIDPRSTADGVTITDLQAQYDHNIRVRDLVSEVNKLVAALEEQRRRLASASGAAADTAKGVSDIRATVVTPPVRYSKPELQAQIQYLYGMTNGADQRVGRDATARYVTLRKELDVTMAKARALLGPNFARDKVVP